MPMLRQSGTIARTMLVSAAATRWSVPIDECKTSLSRVEHAVSGRRLHYRELGNEAAKQRILPVDSLRLKSRSELSLLGKRISGVDNHALVTGQPLFGSDTILPGMKYAIYQKCPATGLGEPALYPLWHRPCAMPYSRPRGTEFAIYRSAMKGSACKAMCGCASNHTTPSY